MNKVRAAWVTASGIALSLALAAPAAHADGYWRLDRTEFVNDAGSDQWTGQSEVRIQLLSHSNSEFVFREAWRSSMSQTYAVKWSVPPQLVPGEVDPFELSETCAESTMGPGWPFTSTKMSPVSLVTEFDSGRI
ncbi:MAG: hypothetical protein U1E50_17450 [Caulobacteraceae bacterium]